MRRLPKPEYVRIVTRQNDHFVTINISSGSLEVGCRLTPGYAKGIPLGKPGATQCVAPTELLMLVYFAIGILGSLNHISPFSLRRRVRG